MSKVVYISKSSIEPKRGPLRILLICRASLSRNVRIRRERNRSILEVAKSYSFRNCLVLAFEQTPRDLPRLASGSRRKRRRGRLKIHQPSRIGVGFGKAHSLHTRISAVNPNSTSLSPALQALSHSRGPCILSFGGPSESGRREKRTMDIVLQKAKRQGSRL